MNRVIWIVFAVAAILSSAGSRAEPITKNCDTNFSYGEVVVYFRNPTVAQEFMAIISDHNRDPDVFNRIWQPKSGRLSSIDWGVFTYNSAQDGAEIARALSADAVLRQRGLDNAVPNGRAVDFSVLPPMVRVTLTEYHNTILDHYFLSSSEDENRIIDTGGAGPGWQRTGETFQSSRPEAVYGAKRVFRFYAPGAHSHFFTADPGECGMLRNLDPGWQFEGDAFGAALPVNGACPTGTQPIYRLYNNRWMYNDSNHRFVTRPDLYAAMQASGWIGEGVAMCAVN